MKTKPARASTRNAGLRVADAALDAARFAFSEASPMADPSDLCLIFAPAACVPWPPWIASV
jgi:hypothetical protein